VKEKEMYNRGWHKIQAKQEKCKNKEQATARYMTMEEYEKFKKIIEDNRNICLMCDCHINDNHCTCLAFTMVTNINEFWKQVSKRLTKKEPKPDPYDLDESSRIFDKPIEDLPAYRMLTREERRELIDWTMQQTKCPFCEERVYCAEQMCSCIVTKWIPREDTLHQHLPESRWIKKPQENLQWNQWGKKERQYCPDLPQGPYSGKNPHPFEDHTGETWERFHKNFRYIGKKHFRTDRKKYEKCYWDEILPEDLWEVTKQCNYDDEEFDYKHHGTWREKKQDYLHARLNNAIHVTKLQDEIKKDACAIAEGQESELYQAHEELKVPEVKIQRTHKDAKLPFFATTGAAGCDLTTIEECLVPAYEQVMVDTGVAMAIPPGYCGQIKPRSGLAMAGITIDAGLIDSDFRGSIMVIVVNRTPRQFLIEKHMKIAQMKFEQAIQPTWKEVKELPPTQRGTKGFRSTRRINVFKAEATNTEHEEFKDHHCYWMEPTLTKVQEKEVRDMMKEFEDIIAIKHSDLPAETIIKHHIDTGTHYPLRQ
jgi:dUTP pyrophosphatase